LFISEFITDVRPVTDAENIVVNTLSRVDTIVMPISLDMQEIAKTQSTDKELQQLKQFTSTSLKLKKFTLLETASIIYCDISEGEIRLYNISISLRKRVFDMIHQISHSNGRATHW